MDALRKLVLATAAMSDEQLEDARRALATMGADPHARDLVLELIDMFAMIGDDPDRRAQVTAACLLALDEGDRVTGQALSRKRRRSGRRLSGCAFLPLALSLGALAWMLFH